MTDFLRSTGIITLGSTQILTFNMDYDRGSQTQKYANGGYASPSHQASFGGQPRLTFSSYDIVGVLSVLGLVDNSVATNHVVAYTQVLKNEGNRSTTHKKYTITQGMASIDSISLSQDQAGVINVSITPTSSDGSTSSVGEADVSMPAISAIPLLYTLGPVTFNTTALVGVIGWTLNPGNSIVAPASDGNYYAMISSLMGHEPSVTVTSFNPAQIESLLGDKPTPLDGTAGIALSIYQTSTGGVVTSTIAKTFTIKTGLAKINALPTAQGSYVTTGMSVMATSDLVHSVIAVS